MIELSPFLVYLTLAIIAAFCILMYFFVRGSDEYTVEEMERTAEPVSTMADSHGRVTMLLWLCYIGLTVWALAYLYQHLAEFLAFP